MIKNSLFKKAKDMIIREPYADASQLSDYDTTELVTSANAYISYIPDLILKAQAIIEQSQSGHYLQRRAGQGHNFWQHRGYQHGDALKSIDWKATAKTQETLILQKEDETTQRMAIHCPFTLSMAYKASHNWMDILNSRLNIGKLSKADARQTNSKYYAALIVSSCLMQIFKNNRHPFTTTATQSNRSSFTDAHIEQQIKELCDDTNINKALGLAPKKHVFWISDFWDDPDDIRAKILDIQNQKGFVNLIQVITYDEFSLPQTGHIVYENVDGTESIDIPVAQDIRDDYQQRVIKHLEALRDIATQTNSYYGCVMLGASKSNNIAEYGFSSIPELVEDMMHSIAIPARGMMQ